MTVPSPARTPAGAYEKVANDLVKALTTEQCIFEGDLVTATGKYAVPLHAPAVFQTATVGQHLMVQITSTTKDKDVPPEVRWVKYSDLRVVRTAQ